jgi:hypothetical protein
MASKHVIVPAMGLLLALAGAARADAIDGRWCHQDGRHLAIRGPQITTPGGHKISGDYSRHFFAYVAPAAEPSAGQTVYLRLISEYLMHSRVGAPSGDGPPEVWNRCPPDVSSLPAVRQDG